MAKRISRHQQNEKISAVRRGELYLVAFDPTVGYEIQKTRPALIIQNDIGNQYSPLTIACRCHIQTLLGILPGGGGG
jgi:hypothetical protein